MACNALTGGYTIPCRNITGGSKRFIISTWSGTTSFNTDVNEIVTGATAAGQFYSFPQRQEVAELKSDAATSMENATKYTHSATLTLNGYDYTNRKLLKSLIENDVNIIIESNSGQFYLMERAYVKSAPVTIGKAYSDSVGTVVTFEAISPDLLKTVSAAYVASLSIL